MVSRFERILIALMFALLAAGVTLVVADAQEGQDPPPAATPDCATCHTQFQMTWQNGPHGQAGTDPVFVAAWTEQGKPGACLACHTTGYDPATATWKADNVTCEACHGEAPADHPASPMPVNRSPDLCGRCHSDTRFGWQDWQGSTHYQRGMNCTTCHDPHSASLKLTTSRDGSGFNDASTLCINCHQEASMNFPYTAHAQRGVSCAECHLHQVASSDRAAHTVPDHSFTASLQRCSGCHSDQMHNAAEAIGVGESTAAVLPALHPEQPASALAPEPAPVSPMGYASLAGLIGLAAGMVTAPWLEKAYRRVRHGEEERND